MSQNDATTPAITSEHMRMLATSANDVSVPIYGTTLRPQDDTLLAKGKSKGLRLYDEIKRDGHARSVLGKRVRKVLSREWTMQPASDDARDVEAAQLVKRMLKNIPFDVTCEGLLEANLYGFAPAEVVWQVKDKEVTPAQIVVNHPGRIVFDQNWQPRLLTPQAPFDGEAQPERKWIVHRVGGLNSDPYGSGLGRVLFWHVLFKREGVGFWSHFLEKYASPTPFAKYPIGTPPSEQDRLMQHLASLVQNGVLVAPLGTEVSFLEAARSGAATYEEWCRFWDEQTSVAVLGENLSTNVKGQGSRAAAQTHDSISDMIASADADLLSATLNETLIKWIVDFNMPGAGYPTIWWPMPRNEEALEDVKQKKADRISKDLDNLFNLTKQGFEPKIGIEQVLSDVFEFEIVKAKTPTVRNEALGSTALTPSFADRHDHGIDALTGQLEVLGQAELTNWLADLKERVRATIARGGSLADFRNELTQAYADIDVDQFGRILGDGLAIGELTGRADVKEEAR